MAGTLSAMNDGEGRPEPSWLPDSTPGRLRWWDGHRWSPHVAADTPRTGPGWYPRPDAPLLGEWDGTQWTGRTVPAQTDASVAGHPSPPPPPEPEQRGTTPGAEAAGSGEPEHAASPNISWWQNTETPPPTPAAAKKPSRAGKPARSGKPSRRSTILTLVVVGTIIVAVAVIEHWRTRPDELSFEVGAESARYVYQAHRFHLKDPAAVLRRPKVDLEPDCRRFILARLENTNETDSGFDPEDIDLVSAVAGCRDAYEKIWERDNPIP